jgi:hypothetical protein
MCSAVPPQSVLLVQAGCRPQQGPCSACRDCLNAATDLASDTYNTSCSVKPVTGQRPPQQCCNSLYVAPHSCIFASTGWLQAAAGALLCLPLLSPQSLQRPGHPPAPCSLATLWSEGDSAWLRVQGNASSSSSSSSIIRQLKNPYA